MEIRPRDNDCGAEIDGVDLQSMSDEKVEAIADAHAAYGVVFLCGQTLTPDHQLAAARRFGAATFSARARLTPSMTTTAITTPRKPRRTPYIRW